MLKLETAKTRGLVQCIFLQFAVTLVRRKVLNLRAFEVKTL